MLVRSRYAGHRFPAEIISHAIWLYFRFPLTIRTQSTALSRHWPITIWTRVTQRNDMADLQAVLMHNDALNDELQNGLSVGKGGLLQAITDALGEGGNICQDLLGLSMLLAELKVLLLLLLQGSALFGELLTPIGQFLEAAPVLPSPGFFEFGSECFDVRWRGHGRSPMARRAGRQTLDAVFVHELRPEHRLGHRRAIPHGEHLASWPNELLWVTVTLEAPIHL